MTNQTKTPGAMVLVPRDLTDDMIIAFAELWYSKRQTIDDPDMKDAYAAMLAVVEQPPAVEAVAYRLFADDEPFDWVGGQPSAADLRDLEDGVLSSIEYAYAHPTNSKVKP